MRFSVSALLLFAVAAAQTPAGEVDVPAGRDQNQTQPSDWTDSGVDVRPGDSLVITAEGTLDLPMGKTCGPEGQPRGFRDLLKAYPVNEAGLGALVGRIGSSDAAQPFLVGASKQMQVRRAGRLFLSVNRSGNDSIDGSFHVKIAFSVRGPQAPKAPTDVKLPVVTQEMIDRIPRRVMDSDGNSGDNTNFVIIGAEQKVIQIFEAAGWVRVDKDTQSAILDGLLAVLSKQAYLTLPMSVLTLFGRPQDYGLAHAEPIAVVAQRHHLRLWKAPFAVERQELWVGAATHDVGFDRDNRAGKKITHKIDPNVDDEREFVGRSLDETGLVAKLSYITPSHPSKEARTATGATFHSDGRVLVIHLTPPEPESSTATAAAAK
jgi:hypothetical protein